MFNSTYIITACAFIYSHGTRSPGYGTYGPDTAFYMIELSKNTRGQIYGLIVRYGNYVDQVTYMFKSEFNSGHSVFWDLLVDPREYQMVSY